MLTFNLQVSSTINRFSQSLIHLLVDLMGQSFDTYINKHFEKLRLILTCCFVWEVTSYVRVMLH